MSTPSSFLPTPIHFIVNKLSIWRSFLLGKTLFNSGFGGACRPLKMDLLLAGVGGLYLSLAFAQKLELPLLQAHVFPFTPTKTFPGVLFPQSLNRYGGTVNWLSHQLLRQIIWQGSRAGDTAARKQVLNLPVSSFFGPRKSPHLHRYPTLYRKFPFDK